MQKFNKKFKLRKSRIKVIRSKIRFTPRTFIKIASKVSQKKYSSVNPQISIKDTPLKSVLVQLYKNQKLRTTLVKKSALGKRMLYASSSRKNLSAKICKTPTEQRPQAQVDLTKGPNKAVAIKYTGKKSDKLAAQSLAKNKIDTQLSMLKKQKDTSTPVSKIEALNIASQEKSAKQSKNWISPDIWAAMSAKERRAFLIKTGKIKTKGVK